ncbi:MAG: FIST N-terminal domain-containing protein [Streptosporangiaceae bacterium]
MRTEMLTWSHEHGWSGPFPPAVPGHTLVLAFGESALVDDPAPLAELVAAYPGTAVTGCSGAGQFASVPRPVPGQGAAPGVRLDPAPLIVTVVMFDQVRVRIVAVRPGSRTSRQAGQELAEQRRPDDTALFVLSSGINVNGDQLTEGIVDGLARTRPAGAPALPVSGGLAGAADGLPRTWVLAGRAPLLTAVVGVFLSGDALQAGYGSAVGWGIFGPARRVTRSDGHVLYEVDGKPALALYKRYLGDRAAGLPATALLFPLGLHTEDGGEKIVRSILAVDETAQSLTFAGDIPQGSTVELMRSTRDWLVDAAGTAAQNAADDIGPAAGRGAGEPAEWLAIAVSCVARRLALGERTEEELDAAFEGLAPNTTMTGFYSYGEIALACGGRTRVHNQTMTVTVFGERQ